MEKSSHVLNGGIRMPIGFRFSPTDEELVYYYLTRKNLGLPLPASVIPDFDVFQTFPWSFPGDLEENRYFFSNSNDYGSKRKRVSGSSAFWKLIGKERLILASGSNQPIGIKKTLVLSNGKKQSQGSNTKWLMHKYCLLDSTRAQMLALVGSSGDWCIYRVFQKKRKANKHGVITPSSPSFIDFTVEDFSGDGSPPQPSSSGSNNVVEDSSNELDQEEDSKDSLSLNLHPHTRK